MNTIGPLPLPTDNLYKFCALIGVAVILFTFYTTGRLTDDLLQRVSAASLAAQKAEIEADFLKRLADRIQKTVDDTKANLSDEDYHKQGKVPLHISEEELHKMVERMNELYRDLRLKFAEVHSATHEITEAQAHLRFIRIVGAVCAAAGAWFALYGFRKWHALQKMQDKALERQVADRTQSGEERG